MANVFAEPQLMVSRTLRPTVPRSAAPPSAAPGRTSRFPLILKAAVPAASVLAVLLADTEGRHLVAPILTMVTLCTWFLTTLWERDHRMPLFELGSICMLATGVYSIMPFVGFYLAGSQWPPGVDARLLRYDFDVWQISQFAWRHAVYMAAFMATYLMLRGSHKPGADQQVHIPIGVFPALVILAAILYAFKWSMYLVYGLDTGFSYEDLEAQVLVMANIPYLLQQFSAAGLASLTVVKLGLMIVLFAEVRRSRSKLAAAALIIWLILEVTAVTVRLGQRGSAVLLLLAATAVYHQLVKPIRPTVVLIGGLGFLLGFLLLGFIRGDNQLEADLNIVGLLTSRNEFQSIFATAYDLFERKQSGLLDDVPWQIHFVDLYLEIPSQFLPFEKIDPAAWYLDLVGERGSGVGYSFGVISQAIVGFDWLELIARGLVLGSLFAMFHRWYVRHAEAFWVTLLYLCVVVWSYYTYRATSLWIIHFVVYQFLPVLLVTKMIQAMLTVGRTSSHAVAPRAAVWRRDLVR